MAKLYFGAYTDDACDWVVIFNDKWDLDFACDDYDENGNQLFKEISHDEAYAMTDGAIDDETTYFEDDVDPDIRYCSGWDWPSEEAFVKSCEKEGIFPEDF
jgi:hypothetical protein